MQVLLSWLVLSAAVLVAAAILPGMRVKGFGGALVAAALFGVLNWLLGWLFFVVIGVATLGLGFLFAFLTRWLVDAIVLKMADSLTDRLTIDGFGTALLGAGIVSIVGTLLEYLVRTWV